jgi:hypothetical protein
MFLLSTFCISVPNPSPTGRCISFNMAVSCVNLHPIVISVHALSWRDTSMCPRVGACGLDLRRRAAHARSVVQHEVSGLKMVKLRGESMALAA